MKSIFIFVVFVFCNFYSAQVYAEHRLPTKKNFDDHSLLTIAECRFQADFVSADGRSTPSVLLAEPREIEIIGNETQKMTFDSPIYGMRFLAAITKFNQKNPHLFRFTLSLQKANSLSAPQINYQVLSYGVAVQSAQFTPVRPNPDSPRRQSFDQIIALEPGREVIRVIDGVTHFLKFFKGSCHLIVE